MGIGGGASGANPFDMLEFIRRVPDGAVLTIEGIMRNVLPMTTMAIAMGLHVRCGIEDNIWSAQGRAHDLGSASGANGAHVARTAP